MAYLLTDSQAQGIELKVQELVLFNSATNGLDSIVTIDGNDIVVEVGQNVAEVRSVLFTDNSAATVAPVVAANVAVSGSEITITLSAPFAVNDSVRLCLVVSE